MKRFLTAMLMLCLLCGFAFGEEVRVFTDSTGRVIELPTKIGCVAVSGTMAQIMVFALAPETLCGVADRWTDAARGIIAEEYLRLPVLGQLYGGKGNMNLETLLAAEPDVLIDVGEKKDGVAAEMDAMEAQIGIPCAHIDVDLNGIPEAFRMLGELLDRREDAEALAAYAEDTLRQTREIAEKVEKTRILYVVGSEGRSVIARDSYHSAVLDLLGENVAVVEAPSAKGTGNEVDIEQILVWNPDFVIFAPDGIYDKVGEKANWRTISAIQSGRYAEVPNAPYNWMGFPPSVQRLLGMKWLAKLLYPQAADYDLYEEARMFFDLFYHCDLTREMFDEITAKSAALKEGWN